MHCFFKKIILFLVLTIGLQAQGGLSQNHLLSVSPTPSQESVSTDTTIEIEFNLEIIDRSVKKHTIVLKNIMENATNKKIAGSTTLKNETTLLFIPNKALESGTYEVKVKKVKLLDYTIDTRFARFVKKMCSHFYDDVKDCRMYRYASRVKSKKIHYSFSVDDSSVSIVSIKLNKSNIQLNENNQTTINVDALYDDNTTQDVTQDVEWIIGNSSIISITNNIITPKAEGTTTLQAKYKNQISTQIQVTVYKEINGYKLPPEPDETLNNSTLLGIDVNDNGVRDDVEIYIIKRYSKDPEFPKTKTAIALQYAWASQKILENPTMDSSKFEDDVIGCKFYWIRQKAKTLTGLETMQFGVKHKIYDYKVKDKILNTRARIERKFEYNSALSGQIFQGKKNTIDMCQINIDELGE